MTTIKDVAAYCNVAVSTVSRVLNNHADVSEETRAKVLEAVRALHYVPNSSARDLVLPQSDSIGLVVRGAENPFFTPVIRAIERSCEATGYTMVLHQIPVGADEVAEGAALAQSKRLRGLILLGGRYDYTHEEVSSIGVPFVCCTYTNHFGDLDRGAFSSVSIDDKAEARRAVRQLVDNGHSKIAIVLDDRNDHSISERRFKGYREILDEAGIPFDEEFVVETGQFEMADAYRKVSEMLVRRPDVTAIFAIADTLAIATMKALADAGLRVPEDCSVIAIDGIEVSNYTVPTLTTLCQPQATLGEEAVRVLVDVLRNGAENRHIRLETTLRPGGSVGSQ